MHSHHSPVKPFLIAPSEGKTYESFLDAAIKHKDVRFCKKARQFDTERYEAYLCEAEILAEKSDFATSIRFYNIAFTKAKMKKDQETKLLQRFKIHSYSNDWTKLLNTISDTIEMLNQQINEFNEIHNKTPKHIHNHQHQQLLMEHALKFQKDEKYKLLIKEAENKNILEAKEVYEQAIEFDESHYEAYKHLADLVRSLETASLPDSIKLYEAARQKANEKKEQETILFNGFKIQYSENWDKVLGELNTLIKNLTERLDTHDQALTGVINKYPKECLDIGNTSHPYGHDDISNTSHPYGDDDNHKLLESKQASPLTMRMSFSFTKEFSTLEVKSDEQATSESSYSSLFKKS